MNTLQGSEDVMLSGVGDIVVGHTGSAFVAYVVALNRIVVVAAAGIHTSSYAEEDMRTCRYCMDPHSPASTSAASVTLSPSSYAEASLS